MATKKTSMQNEVEKSEQQKIDNSSVHKGEQMYLLDVNPEIGKKIVGKVRDYRAKVRCRIAATNEEVPAKQELLKLILDSEQPRQKDGSIKFQVDGLMVTITPGDYGIKVKEVKED